MRITILLIPAEKLFAHIKAMTFIVLAFVLGPCNGTLECTLGWTIFHTTLSLFVLSEGCLNFPPHLSICLGIRVFWNTVCSAICLAQAPFAQKLLLVSGFLHLWHH